MTTTATHDAIGRRRSPATYSDSLAGRAPKNKGRRYPADPPRAAWSSSKRKKRFIQSHGRSVGKHPDSVEFEGWR